jgi:phospholipase/carboxylesterase
MPSAAKVGIRGAVLTNGGYAFFRRFPDRRIDEQDLTARLSPVTELIATALSEYGLSERPLAVGYSNGAIMVAAILQTHPELVSGAILFRPLSPFAVAPAKPSNGLPVLILDGATDERRRPHDGQVLAQTLRHAGADVSHEVLSTGHAICERDELIANQWIQSSWASQTRPRRYGRISSSGKFG